MADPAETSTVLPTVASVVVLTAGTVVKKFWSRVIADFLIRFALVGVAALITLIPGAEGQSVAAMAVFIAIALFVLIHSHRERRRRRAIR
jgi:hypothetical protein